MNEFLSKIEQSDVKYRPVPFWSWNDKLDPELLKWQINEMKKSGLGGFFMHARGGLETPYMGEEWMNCVEKCVKEAESIGMNAWCYDENGWPSGFADGTVPALGDKYLARYIVFEKIEDGVILNNVLFYYIQENGGYRHLLGDISGATHVVREIKNKFYIDTLNKEVVTAFLEKTHEKYYSQLGEYFNGQIKGFFTDEPLFYGLPWSTIFQEKFIETFDYDLADRIPELFFNIDGFEQVRYQYWSLANTLFTEAFGKQIYDWCKNHNCKFTGHVMNENNLNVQMSATGGVMPFYEYMDIPGIDWLGRNISNPVIPKQVSSVAAQLGKSQVLTETFGLCGWNVGFEELKWIADWQFVNGINLICQHLAGYTLRGLRKRDYPPSLFFQQPWWEEYKYLNDYFARIGMILAEGKSLANVLLLHPIKSGWLTFNGGTNEVFAKLDDEFQASASLLSKQHIDWHFGDETIISKYAKVCDNIFVVGECSYKAVILPPLKGIDSTTLKLLIQYVENGGVLLYLGEWPAFCDGVVDERLAWLKSYAVNAENLYLNNLLNDNGVCCVSISDETGEIEDVALTLYEYDGKQVLFAVNLNHDVVHKVKIKIDGNKSIAKLSLEDMTITGLECDFTMNVTEVIIEFAPMQSHILLIDVEAEKDIDCDTEVITLVDEFNLEVADFNSLTMDICSYRINNGEWMEKIAVIRLMRMLLEKKETCDIELKFEFKVNSISENMFLVMEKPDDFCVTLNDNIIEYTGDGWWLDTQFKKVNIRQFVKEGKNELILKGHFWQRQKVYDVLYGDSVHATERNKLTLDTELESVYIVGDFGVYSETGYTEGERNAIFTDGNFYIGNLPKTLRYGDLTSQGFCFFAGAITISQKLNSTSDKRIILDLQAPNATVLKLFINGYEKTIAWKPYLIDITRYVKSGENKIEIKLYSSCRNLLGPHHNIKGENYSVGTTTFSDKAGWADGVPIGSNIWRGDDYCFVKFGL